MLGCSRYFEGSGERRGGRKRGRQGGKEAGREYVHERREDNKESEVIARCGSRGEEDKGVMRCILMHDAQVFVRWYFRRVGKDDPQKKEQNRARRESRRRRKTS